MPAPKEGRGRGERVDNWGYWWQGSRMLKHSKNDLSHEQLCKSQSLIKNIKI